MATRTWSWSASGGASSNIGTSWLTYYLSGTAVPSGAVISKVEYTIGGYVGQYTTSSSNTFRLYGVAVSGGPYTGASYGASSPSTIYSTISAATSTSTSNQMTRPSSGYKSYSFQSGTAYVWRYSSARTYVEAVDCDFVSNTSSTSPFFNNYLYLQVKFNTSLSGTFYLQKLEVKVTYTEASVTAPTGVTITQNNNGTYTISWNASTGTGGSGSINYEVWSVTDGVSLQYSTSRSYTATIPSEISHIYEYRIYAYYSGVGSSGTYISKTFSAPAITGPTSVSLSTTQASSVTVSWPAATLSYTTGTVSYNVYYRLNNGNYQYYTNTSSTSLTLSDAVLDSLGDDRDKFKFQVDGRATNLSFTAGNTVTSLTYESPDSAEFTYYSPNTVAYRTSSGWQECIAYYRDGTGWQECDVYYRDANGWQLVKSKVT